MYKYVYQCEGCGAVFNEPETYHIWSRYEVNEDDVFLCPKCGDQRIHIVLDNTKNTNQKGEEKKNNE